MKKVEVEVEDRFASARKAKEQVSVCVCVWLHARYGDGPCIHRVLIETVA